MEPSTKAFELIRFFEGSNVCRLKAYLDTGGVPTIGWGTTSYPDGRRVRLGDICTEDEADEFLVHDVKSTVDDLKRLVKVNISQLMFDALVSFVYNIGASQFQKSTLLRLLNEKKTELASQEFVKWKFDNGKVQPGLLKRRLAEQKLFREGMESKVAPDEKVDLSAPIKEPTVELTSPKPSKNKKK